MVRRSITIASFILATLLAVGGVELLYKTLGQALVPDSQKSPATSRKIAAEKPGKAPSAQVGKTQQKQKARKAPKKENYSVITRRSLFGKIKPKETTKKEVAPVAPLKATSLDLTLLGTISGGANVQRAIIQDKKKRTQDLYQKGDAVGSAIIKEVLRGKVILTVNNKDEILLMEELKSSQVPDKVKKTTSSRRRKKAAPPPQADVSQEEDDTTTETASPLRKLTFKNDDTQETDQ